MLGAKLFKPFDTAVALPFTVSEPGEKGGYSPIGFTSIRWRFQAPKYTGLDLICTASILLLINLPDSAIPPNP
jgi:hypothetical protein